MVNIDALFRARIDGNSRALEVLSSEDEVFNRSNNDPRPAAYAITLKLTGLKNDREMTGTHQKKPQITAALDELRIQLQNESLLLGSKFNLEHRLVDLIRNHPWRSVSIAAVSGWLLSRVPTRKKTIYVSGSSQQKVKKQRSKPLDKHWKNAWKKSKPLIAEYLAKNLADHSNRFGQTALNRNDELENGRSTE